MAWREINWSQVSVTAIGSAVALGDGVALGLGVGATVALADGVLLGDWLAEGEDSGVHAVRANSDTARTARATRGLVGVDTPPLSPVGR
jgi:hypothetical protein